MTDYVLIALSAALVNNLALIQLLGICPVGGSSRGLQNGLLLALATTIVLMLSAGVNHLIYAYLLEPLHLLYLRTLIFMLTIAALVPLTGRVLSRASRVLQGSVEGYTWLVVVNSAVLGVPLLNVQASRGFFESMVYALGGALGISLVLILFAVVRERIAVLESPSPFKGVAIELITLGLMSLAFMGFVGLSKT